MVMIVAFRGGVDDISPFGQLRRNATCVLTGLTSLPYGSDELGQAHYVGLVPWCPAQYDPRIHPLTRGHVGHSTVSQVRATSVRQDEVAHYHHEE